MNAAFWVLAVLGLVVWTALMVALALVVARVLSRDSGGGWKSLRRQFPADREPAMGQTFRRETVQVGLVRGKNSTTVIVGPAGLYLRAPFLGAALVPWRALRDPTPTTLFWFDAMRFDAGEPASRITVRRAVYEAMRPYLGHQGPGQPEFVPPELVEAHV